MSQHYSDPEREDETYSLPDLEVWQDWAYKSRCCDTDHPKSYATACAEQPCFTCEKPASYYSEGEKGWFYWFCFPGCMPDSEPHGPFATEAEALADARDSV